MEDKLAVRFYEDNIVARMKKAEADISLLQKLGIALQTVEVPEIPDKTVFPAPEYQLITATVGAAGNVDVGTHYCICTFIDDDGETDINTDAATTITVSTSAKTVALSTIPLGKWGTIARNIYVTIAGATKSDVSAYRLLTTVSDNTTTTATYDTADADLSAITAPTSNTTGSRPAFPQCVTIWAEDIITSVTTAYLYTASQRYAFTRYTPVANANNGDLYTASFFIGSGTYSLNHFAYSETSFGKADYYIDGILIGTLDWNGTGYNILKTISSISIPTSGYHHLLIKINGTTGSDYSIAFTKIYFQPAAY